MGDLIDTTEQNNHDSQQPQNYLESRQEKQTACLLAEEILERGLFGHSHGTILICQIAKVYGPPHEMKQGVQLHKSCLLWFLPRLSCSTLEILEENWRWSLWLQFGRRA